MRPNATATVYGRGLRPAAMYQGLVTSSTQMIARPTWLLLLVVLCSAVAAESEHSQRTYPTFATAKTLRVWCLGKGAVRSSCLGYVAGVVDLLRSSGASSASGISCLPSKLAAEQVRLLFLNHMHRHPQRHAHGAADEVRAALADAFPCSSPRDKPSRGSGRDRIS